MSFCPKCGHRGHDQWGCLTPRCECGLTRDWIAVLNERERLLARLEALAQNWQEQADGSASAAVAREGLSDARELSDYSAAMTRRAADLRALITEERARWNG